MTIRAAAITGTLPTLMISPYHIAAKRENRHGDGDVIGRGRHLRHRPILQARARTSLLLPDIMPPAFIHGNESA